MTDVRNVIIVGSGPTHLRVSGGTPSAWNSVAPKSSGRTGLSRTYPPLLSDDP